MKKKIIFFISLFLSFHTIFSQSLSIEYEMSLKLGEVAQTLPADLVKKLTNMAIDFKYNYVNNKSKYIYFQQRAKDPNIPKMQSSGEVVTTIYKDFNNKIIYQISAQLPGIVSKETLECTTKWNIKKETIVIAGHSCRKATAVDDSGTTLNAWYALDISISDGPGNYCGLPGMILRVETDASIVQATNVQVKLKNQKNEEIVMPKAEQYITESEFVKMTKKRH